MSYESCFYSREKRCDDLKDCFIIGNTKRGAICDPQATHAVVLDIGLLSALHIAHEIGHL